jgi:hypothetical protein
MVVADKFAHNVRRTKAITLSAIQKESTITIDATQNALAPKAILRNPEVPCVNNTLTPSTNSDAALPNIQSIENS